MTMTELPPTEEQTESEAPEPAENEKKKRSNLLPALVLAVGMIAAAFLMRPIPGDGGTASTTTVPPGAVVALDPMTLNLDDGHLIRIGVALELAESADAEKFEAQGATNRLKDLIIFEVSQLKANSVSTPAGLERLKETLVEGAEGLYGEEFHGLYLTDLVVQ